MSGMDSNDVDRQRLKMIFGAVLSTDLCAEDLTTDRCERWDSLHHIKLILAVEREFAIEIDADAVDQMYSSFENCLEYVRSILRARK